MYCKYSPVIWLLLEPERSAVVEVSGKFTRCPLAQHINGGGHLLLGDSFVLLLFGGGAEALPRQSSLNMTSIMTTLITIR